ncbi:MAG: hypothetical protein ACI8RD_000572 [Bacillariaceae sp.]|jgi:hypothetical protein
MTIVNDWTLIKVTRTRSKFTPESNFYVWAHLSPVILHTVVTEIYCFHISKLIHPS